MKKSMPAYQSILQAMARICLITALTGSSCADQAAEATMGFTAAADPMQPNQIATISTEERIKPIIEPIKPVESSTVKAEQAERSIVSDEETQARIKLLEQAKQEFLAFTAKLTEQKQAKQEEIAQYTKQVLNYMKEMVTGYIFPNATNVQIHLTNNHNDKASESIAKIEDGLNKLRESLEKLKRVPHENISLDDGKRIIDEANAYITDAEKALTESKAIFESSTGNAQPAPNNSSEIINQKDTP